MFLWPTTTKRITSNYGYRTHPITKKRTLHPGIDIAESGTHQVFAAASGTVTRSYRSTSYGECVFVLHKINGVTYETVYAHMRGGSRRVKVNQRVKKGQVIGIMGNTGNSTGQHLHFEIHCGRWNINKSNSVDPLKYLSRKDKTIKQLQKNLKNLGYNPGQIDGVDGDKTKRAVKAFQRDEKLKVDGIAGKQTLAKIKEVLKGGLTVKQYKELKKEITSLRNQLNKKQDKPSNDQTPDEAHKTGTEFAIAAGLTDGSNPHHYLLREQLNTIMYRLHKGYLKLDPSIAEEIAGHFDLIEPYLHEPERWKEQLSNNDIELYELLGMFMLVFLRQQKKDMISSVE